MAGASAQQAPQTGCGTGVCGPCTKCKDTEQILSVDDLLKPLEAPEVTRPDRSADRAALLDTKGNVYVAEHGSGPSRYEAASALHNPAQIAQQHGVGSEGDTQSVRQDATYSKGGYSPMTGTSTGPDSGLVSITRTNTQETYYAHAHAVASNFASIQGFTPSYNGERAHITVSHLGASATARESTPMYSSERSVDRAVTATTSNEKSIVAEKAPTHDKVVTPDKPITAEKFSSSVVEQVSVSNSLISTGAESRTATTGLAATGAPMYSEQNLSRVAPSLPQSNTRSEDKKELPGIEKRGESIESSSSEKTPSREKVAPGKEPTRELVTAQTEKVSSSINRLENVIRQNNNHQVVQQAVASLYQSANQAAISIPAMSAVANQISTISRVFHPPVQDPVLSVRIVQANIPALREMLAAVSQQQAPTPQTPLQRQERIRVQPQVPPSNPAVSIQEQRATRSPTAPNMEATRVLSNDMRHDRQVARVSTPETAHTTTNSRFQTNLLRNSVQGHTSRDLQARIANLKTSLDQKLSRDEALRDKNLTQNRGSSRDDLVHRIKEVKRDLSRVLKRELSSKESNGLTNNPRVYGRRFDLLKRINEGRLEQRRKPTTDRRADFSQQQELYKLANKILKKLRRGEEEDLLGLLSPMEQRLMRNVLKKLDAAATLQELKKAVRAEKKKATKHQPTTEATPQEATTSSKAQASANTASTKTDKKTTTGGPSKSLDLNTGKTDDVNSHNAYEAALR